MQLTYTNQQIVEYLLSKSTNNEYINKADTNGYTPLHFSVLENNYECAKTFIKHRSNINLKTSVGYTPLRIASQKNVLFDDRATHIEWC